MEIINNSTSTLVLSLLNERFKSKQKKILVKTQVEGTNIDKANVYVYSAIYQL